MDLNTPSRNDNSVPEASYPVLQFSSHVYNLFIRLLRTNTQKFAGAELQTEGRPGKTEMCTSHRGDIRGLLLL